MPDITDEQRKALEEKIKHMSPEELREFQKQQCIFCQIIAGKVPAKKVYEDEKCIGVLDINPAAKGHVLIMPKEHYVIMPQIPDKEIGHLFLVSKYLSQAMLKVMKVPGTMVYVANGLAAGQKAQHFMVHLIPRKDGDGIIDSTEKLLDLTLQRKVHLAVEHRLNQLLGIKKEVVVIDDGKEQETAAVEKKRDVPELLPQDEKKGEEEETEMEKEGGVSLDDIARLFK